MAMNAKPKLEALPPTGRLLVGSNLVARLGGLLDQQHRYPGKSPWIPLQRWAAKDY